MSRVERSVNWLAKNPVHAIMVLVAVTMFFFGLYVFSPLYVVQSGAAISMAFGQDTAQRAFVGLGLYVLPSLPIVLSLFFEKFRNPKWYAIGCQGVLVGLLFLTLLRILAVGITPLQWVFSLALGIIMGICYLYWRVKE